MANHVPTNAASGAIKGGMFGAILGYFAIPALAAGVIALGGLGLGLAGATIGAAAGLTAIAASFIVPVNMIMATYGAAGFGLFGAAHGADRGMHENTQEQARSAYVNAYAQTRAGIEQMAMQAYAAPEMPIQRAANDNPYNQASSKIDAATIENHGKQPQLALAQGEGR